MEINPVNLTLLTLSQSALVLYCFPHVFPSRTLTFFMLICSLINFFIFAVYKLFLYPFFLSPFKHLPTPPGAKPLFGHGLVLFQRPPGGPHLKMMQTTQNNGIIRTRGFLHADRLILTTPEALADVLVHRSYDFEKPPWTRAFLRKFLGDGLLIAEGDEHKHHRKQIMPAFQFRHVKGLYPVFWSKSIEFCNALKTSLNHTQSTCLEIGHYATQVTLDIIGLAGLGRDIASLRNADDELIKNYEEILEPSTEKAIYFMLHLMFPPWLVGMLPWSLNERVKVTTNNLKRICKDFVMEKKLKMKHEAPQGQESRDILSIMIRSNDFSDDNLVDQLLTFLAAGHETTSSALTWASHLLSTHPEIQTRLRSEIHQSIPDPKALFDPSFDIAGLLEGMPYLNGVCNEVLRLYPTVPVSARVAIRDTTVASHFIPKGTMLFLVPWATNRMSDLWGPNSEAFVPERWIDKETGRATMNGGADSNFSFLTFLHGPRSCIGEKFARAELRALVVTLVGSFEMQMADPLEKITVAGTITIKPKNGMKLRLTCLEWG